MNIFICCKRILLSVCSQPRNNSHYVRRLTQTQAVKSKSTLTDAFDHAREMKRTGQTDHIEARADEHFEEKIIVLAIHDKAERLISIIRRNLRSYP